MKSKTKKWLVLSIVVWLFAIGSALSAFALTRASSSPTATTISGPVQLIGTWTGNAGGISVTADITEGHIQIDLALANGMTGLYWIGTFDTTDHMVSQFTVTSKGETETMKTKLLASQDATKVFTYKNGTISYPFSMVGVSMTVQLARSPQ